jgi:hypothetical protein
MNASKLILRAAVIGALATLPAAAFAQAAAAKPAAAPAKAASQKTFASPEEAASALVDAAKARDVEGLLAVVGPASKSWIFSGDKVADENDWKKFVAAYDQKKNIKKVNDTTAELEVGSDDWPFPAPIVKKGNAWAFDAEAGKAEVLNRRVGRNELDAIQTMLAIVDAQREYAAKDPDKNGHADYAKKFASTPGKKDGLFWPDESGKDPSPLGPLVATAAKEGYKKSDKPQPYHGYNYRILTSQGKDAKGGAYNYLVRDKLIGGFAVVAWPASYRSSGVTTFIVNHDGVVYEKDLGPQTESVASGMKAYNPDSTWKKAE